MSPLRRLSVLIATASVVLVACSTTAQAQVSVGELAPSPEPYCINGPYDDVPGPGASLSTYTVPVSGVLTSWSTKATAGAGQTLTFKVYRHLGGVNYSVVGHDGPRELIPSMINTFKAAIPVQAGDIIGNDDLAHVNVVPNACLFITGNPADKLECQEGDAIDGATFEVFPTCEEEVRPNETATILPPPTVTSLTPASGSFKGGASVVIGGTNFAELKGVSFGSVPATSFTVNSEGQITAVAPPSTKLSKVNVTVTTIAGVASSTTQFSYDGCKVPKLLGKKLKASKKKARKAGCKIGKVTKRDGATLKIGKVVKQSPKPGKLLPTGSKIKLTLGE